MRFNKGVSLLELLVVIVMIGVLAIVAFTQYAHLSERARYSEALVIMDKIRKAEKLYYNRFDTSTSDFRDLILEENVPDCNVGGCTGVSWFCYAATGYVSSPKYVLAHRCEEGTQAGKGPSGEYYTIGMYENGTLFCREECDKVPVRLPPG